MRYERTQATMVPLVLFSVFEAIVLVSIILGGVDWPLIVGVAVFLALIAVVLLVFSRLTVQVQEAEVTVFFGWGWPRKRISLAEVTTASIVRNRWWYGWGIRVIPHGWLWNVWGLDAVELKMTNGRVFRIGTDDPQHLLNAFVGRVSIA